MMMKKITYFFLITAIYLAASCTQEPLPAGKTQGPEQNVSGEVVIKFDASLEDILDGIAAAGPGTRSVATRSGIGPVDDVMDIIGGYEIERVFRVNPKTEDKARKAGLHLWYVVRFSEQSSVDDVVKKLSALGEVQKASPVRNVVRAYNASRKAAPLSPGAFVASKAVSGSESGYPFNDELLGYQWHLVNRGWSDQFTVDAAENKEYKFDEAEAKGKFVAGSDISCERAWEKCKGDPSIIVAVLDEGVCLSHPDLMQNIWVNESEVWGSGEDNDGNGYAGDRYGYDFINECGKISWDNLNDTGHGTHVAGIIAAVNDNNIGISSVAGGTPDEPGVRIMSCQVFAGDKVATNMLYLVNAIKYAADNGAVVLQCSWGYLSGDSNSFENGGQGPRNEEEWAASSPLEKEILDYFIHNAGSPDGVVQGGIPVFAAGNEGAPSAGFPGAAEGCVSVASIAADFTPSVFTNYDRYTRITAPGGDIDYYYDFVDDEHQRGEVGCVLSTLPPNISPSGYGYMEGTSMACPHVSGVIALGLSYAAKLHKHFKASEIVELLYGSSSSFDDAMKAKRNKFYYKYHSEVKFTQMQSMEMSRYVGKMGAGLVDAAAFLNAIEDENNGIQMMFPNIYISFDGAVTAFPAYYFDADSFSITVSDPSVATVAKAGSQGEGSASVSGVTDTDKVVFYGHRTGFTKAKITYGGKSQDFVITVRKSTK